MKNAVAYLCFAALVLGSLAIGAELVTQGHPWFGLLVILIGAGVRFSNGIKETR
jgi:hypothetical protein